ncbi:MAG: PUA domain-containing protein, partial [Actinomycetota bacterium]
ADPRIDHSASLIEVIHEIDSQTEAMAGGAGTVRGSGGMASKLAAAKIASWSGVSTVIANAAREGVVADAAAGVAGVGTSVPARESRLAARKLWIAFAVVAQGRVVVDPGARRALESGKSLLAAGVRDVDGAFDPGAPVDVVDTDGSVFAKGLARHGSDEIGRVAGQRSDALPAGAPAVVIHADDLVTIPA